MTVEELEILVSASIDPAVREMKNLMPQIKQQIGQVVKTTQQAMNQIDIKKIGTKVQQGVQLVKKKIENLKKSSKNNELAITVNNKEASKQISQIQKQIDSLQEKINSRQIKLNTLNPQIDKIVYDTRKSVTPDGISSNSKAIDNLVNNELSKNRDFSILSNQAQKLYSEIEIYNKELKEAKVNMAQLRQQTSQTATTQNKLSSFFNSFKGKLEQAKVHTKGLKNTFSQIPKITQNITNNIKNISGKMKQGLGHILKYAGALFSIRGIYRLISGSAQSWLSSQNAGAQQLSANIDYLKYSMGSVFAPIIQFITNLVYNLMKAIQSLVYAFSGVNIFAKATASSMKSVSKSAKDTNKSLAGVHTDINNISDSKNSGDSSSISPSIDLSQVDTNMNLWANKWKSKLSEFFEPIKKAWNKEGKNTITAMKKALSEIFKTIRSIGNSFKKIWLNGTGEKTVKLLLQILTDVFSIVENISRSYKNAWNDDNRGTKLVQAMWDALNKLLELIKAITKAVKDFTSNPIVEEYFKNAIEMITNLWNVLGGLLDYITGIFTGDWEKAWNGMKNFSSSILSIIGNIINEKLIIAKGIIFNATNSIKNTWNNVWQNISNFASNTWKNLLNSVDNIFPRYEKNH